MARGIMLMKHVTNFVSAWRSLSACVFKKNTWMWQFPTSTPKIIQFIGVAHHGWPPFSHHFENDYGTFCNYSKDILALSNIRFQNHKCISVQTPEKTFQSMFTRARMLTHIFLWVPNLVTACKKCFMPQEIHKIDQRDNGDVWFKNKVRVPSQNKWSVSQFDLTQTLVTLDLGLVRHIFVTSWTTTETYIHQDH